jgi:hypothetical protein
MIQISQLKLPISETEDKLAAYIAAYLKLSPDEITEIQVQKRSIDARKKPLLYYVYTVAFSVAKKESEILRRHRKDDRISAFHPVRYQMPDPGKVPLYHRPLVIGMGPAGLFCGYLLAKAGYSPIVIERGKPVEERKQDVERFWKTGLLDPASNVQFGEGGAGTFSDGKLNTLVKDKTGRNRFVLETFVNFGAPGQILWDAKPHIGTDILVDVVRNMRREILRLGGEIHFQEQWMDFTSQDGVLKEISTTKDSYAASVAVLALGHSARDSFTMLHRKQVVMSAKEFAVGFRMEHPQSLINESQYGKETACCLPAAPYKVATRLPSGRGVYSFCMCPGGYVVNASSAPQQLAVNGMSYARRDSDNANSAIVVSVGAKEFDLSDPLSAMHYQIHLEKKAFELGKGKIPQQLLGDFIKGQASRSYGDFPSMTRGATELTDLRSLFSGDINHAFLQGIELFDTKIKGFGRYDAILSGVESRTSSPVRILRNEQLQSNISGMYPCGEGAGYAGGITSAAMDGLRIAEKIIRTYQVQYE